MKKILLVSAVALCAASTASAHNWYAGVGLGWKEGKYKGELSQADLTGGDGWFAAKGTFSKGSAFGGFFGGHKFTLPSYNVFLQLNASMDAKTQTKKVLNPSNVRAMEGSMRRVGSMGVDLGVAKEFKNIDFSAKLGLIVSQFEMAINLTTNPGTNYSGKKATQYGVGFTPGIGIGKSMGSYAVGFNYEYQIYGRAKYTTDLTTNGRVVSLKTNPRYHVMTLSVKKDF